MKIYTKVVLDLNSMNVVDSDGFEYIGPVAQCFSGGGSSEKSSSYPIKVPVWTPEQYAISQALLPDIARGLGYEFSSRGTTTAGPAGYGPQRLFGRPGGKGGTGGMFSLSTSPLSDYGEGKYSLTPSATGGVPKYPGMMYVPKTPEEIAYFMNSPDYANAISSMSELGGLRANMAKPAFDITPETTEQFYQSAIRDPAMKEWQETVEPTIRESFAGPGYWGSARATAQVEGAEDLASQLSQQRGQLAYADEMARRQALEGAKMREAMYAPGTYAMEAEARLKAGELAETAGASRAALSRTIEEQEALSELQRWLMGEKMGGVTPRQYNPYMQLAFQYLGLQPYAVGTSSTSKGSSMNFGILS